MLTANPSVQEQVEATRSYQELCELGRMARMNMDNGRWIIGDLAIEIETVYAENTIDDFAKEIGVDPKRVYEYRAMSKFYEISVCTEYLAANPGVTWSHMERVKRKVGSTEAAYAILDRCSANGWTVRELEHHLADIKPLVELTLPVADLGLDLRAATQLAGKGDAEIVRVVITEIVS